MSRWLFVLIVPMVVLIFPVSLAFAADTAVLCIPLLQPEPKNGGPGELVMGSPDSYVSPYATVKVQVDQREPIELSSKAGGRVENLDAAATHVVRIRLLGAKRDRVSFRFSFAQEGSEALCLLHNNMYGTFFLENGDRCGCVMNNSPSVFSGAPD